MFVVESRWQFFYLVGDPYFKYALHVVLFEMVAADDFSLPIDGGLIYLVEMISEELFVGSACGFDSEGIHYETQFDVFRGMLEDAWCIFSGNITSQH